MKRSQCSNSWVLQRFIFSNRQMILKEHQQRKNRIKLCPKANVPNKHLYIFPQNIYFCDMILLIAVTMVNSYSSTELHTHPIHPIKQYLKYLKTHYLIIFFRLGKVYHYVAWANLDLGILLPPSPKCWDSNCEPPRSALPTLFFFLLFW